MPIHHLLAPELIHNIAISLDKSSDLKNFRSVCKPISYAVEPILFSTMHINIVATGEEFMNKRMDLFEYLAEQCSTQDTSGYTSKPGTRISAYVRTLKIGMMAPEYRGSVFRDGVVEKPGIDEELLKECAAKFEAYFRDAIGSLSNARRVEWMPNSVDLPWTHEVIINHLNKLSQSRSLTELTLNINHCDKPSIPIHLLTLHGLDKLTFICKFFNESSEAESESEPSYPYLTAATSLILCNIQTLKSLHLEDTQEHSTMEKLPLDVLLNTSFPSSSTTTSNVIVHPLRLELLHAPRWTLTHIHPSKFNFCSLTSLNINSMSDSAWRALQMSRAQLRKLIVGHVSEGLLAYLCSYDPQAGLEILHLNLNSSPVRRSSLAQQSTLDLDSESNTRLAVRFFEEVLPKHGETLRELDIRAQLAWGYHGWVLGREWGTEVLCDLGTRFPILEVLGVGFRSVEVRAGEAGDVVATLLRTILPHPTLTTLTLHTVSPPYEGWCGNGRRDWWEKITKGVREAVLRTGFDEFSGDSLGGSSVSACSDPDTGVNGDAGSSIADRIGRKLRVYAGGGTFEMGEEGWFVQRFGEYSRRT